MIKEEYRNIEIEEQSRFRAGRLIDIFSITQIIEKNTVKTQKDAFALSSFYLEKYVRRPGLIINKHRYANSTSRIEFGNQLADPALITVMVV